MSPPTDARWSATLDELEASVAALEASLDDRDADDRGADAPGEPAFAPPAGLGPLPPTLRTRAADLRRRMVEVETRLACSLREARRTLVVADAMSARDRAPRFVDARA